MWVALTGARGHGRGLKARWKKNKAKKKLFMQHSLRFTFCVFIIQTYRSIWSRTWMPSHTSAHTVKNILNDLITWNDTFNINMRMWSILCVNCAGVHLSERITSEVTWELMRGKTKTDRYVTTQRKESFVFLSIAFWPSVSVHLHKRSKYIIFLDIQ